MTHIPYGYRVKDAKGIIYEPEADKVVALYRAYLEYDSMSAAAKKVRINKIHGSIGRILKNTVYLGTDFYPQLLDEELFTKVQKARKENAVRENRIKEIKPAEEFKPITTFKASKVKLKFDDPYKQAEYAYSMIKEG